MVKLTSDWSIVKSASSDWSGTFNGEDSGESVSDLNGFNFILKGILLVESAREKAKKLIGIMLELAFYVNFTEIFAYKGNCKRLFYSFFISNKNI